MGYLIAALILAMVAGILITMHAFAKQEAKDSYEETHTQATYDYHMSYSRFYLIVAIFLGGLSSILMHTGAEKVTYASHTTKHPAHVDTVITFSGLQADTAYTYKLNPKK